MLGPVLEHSYGVYAPAVMALLCLAAYAFGDAIRFNITRRLDGESGRSATEQRLETVASWALAIAYVISVAYYLNLFGAFAVDLTPFAGDLAGRIVTTAIFGVILITGWAHGFQALERMEQVSVGIKLAIISSMLAGLAVYFSEKLNGGGLVFDPPTLTGWPAVQLAFGLIVTVQGFETARYLGAEYDAPTRRRAMRIAQLLSTAIYLAYIGLIAYLFTPDQARLSETAIIDMMQIVAPVLPGLLVAAALAAQFSAAVADRSSPMRRAPSRFTTQSRLPSRLRAHVRARGCARAPMTYWRPWGLRWRPAAPLRSSRPFSFARPFAKGNPSE
ncbi:hypothetical protein OEW28_06330 [Defluviimonas sp. WL0002]|uniref:APC family permease n=1 Tax=Albidovulum marisflavi TaxID=2984159 RepID=A0ABT2ZAS8_9RHOB|nr:amino acid permease [Defluviimonas sp. WL0002]MCV2868243.1 hypothetical protein [Defluviimonas sp. WL0002]